ncbi:polymeric immunoglobulin receptor-like [Pygocentrus nattereri]|uniref:Ig-like domain-containing protein n=1 Tax=Pygocentrus nattereri TaxID=42514 RepID=A0AAR2JLE7_PYGNA|nr:polymeric immunoglobulin receptor-like [Pygocentrus nattereri]XP_037386962.1 polymeric immunoglobulin receptor-like [Pygocentrus nattereri]
MRFYSLMSSLILLVLLLCISDSESLKTLKNLTVKTGESLTIPCFYDGKYKSNLKYWCQGYYWSTCQIVAYTNTSGRTSVTDHPSQNMFTVELNSLQDSGYYWCAVEIGRKWTPDDRDYLYLTVSADPAVTVINSRVSGQEGGSISAQCLYSAEYKNKQKKWCRFKDWSCFTVGRTDTSQNSAVLVSDDRKGSVSVEMRGLQKSDAGWYWFSAGDVGVTVHLTVATIGGDEMRSNNEGSQLDDTTLALTIIIGLFLLLTLVGLVIWKVKHKQILTAKGGSSGYSAKPDVVYADVVFSRWTQRNPNKLPQAGHDDRVIYSSVKTSQ